MPERMKRLLLASNRLPVVLTRDTENGEWDVRSGSGGLITAIAPIMKRSAGVWVGWPGSEPHPDTQEVLTKFGKEQGIHYRAVELSDEEVRKYYRGFANATIWPLFHDLLGYCEFDLDNWNTYCAVNKKFAETLAAAVEEDSFIWVHDYQLMLVGHYMRQLETGHSLNYFLHIPFPSLDLFRRIPWNRQIIDALLDYDNIGFQTLRDRRNFVHTVRSLFRETEVAAFRRHTIINYKGRQIKIGNYPISIDFDEFSEGSDSREVSDAAWYLHENFPGQQLVLGVDRLDYTKGIPERLLAFERLLVKYPELQEKITLIQVVVPSRTIIPDYQDLKSMLDKIAGRINARFATHRWTPIHYVFRSLDRTQLLAHYKACEIGLLTPLRDGMNLVAKEYCAASKDNNGVLILSEFAGVADQFARRGAIIVNPYDLEGTADAIYQAFIMPHDERHERMKALRAEVKRNDVHAWVRWFLQGHSLATGRPENPAIEEPDEAFVQ